MAAIKRGTTRQRGGGEAPVPLPALGLRTRGEGRRLSAIPSSFYLHPSSLPLPSLTSINLLFPSKAGRISSRRVKGPSPARLVVAASGRGGEGAEEVVTPAGAHRGACDELVEWPLTRLIRISLQLLLLPLLLGVLSRPPRPPRRPPSSPSSSSLLPSIQPYQDSSLLRLISHELRVRVAFFSFFDFLPFPLTHTK